MATEETPETSAARELRPPNSSRALSEPKRPEVPAERHGPAAQMARLARLARARGYLWTAFYNLYAASIVEGDTTAGFQLAEVLTVLRPRQPRPATADPP